MAVRTLVSKRTLAAGVVFRQQLRVLQTFSLPDLPCGYGALKPAISGDIMHLHHQKHHQTCINNYNKALEQLHDAISKADSPTVAKLHSAINSTAEEGGGEPPKGSLGCAIDTNFGSPEALVKKMNAEGVALQGSGWVWLGVDKELKRLVIETTANLYKNVRPDYLKNTWKVINWKYVNDVYESECP
ncbi:unnamed protein product [Withania somnifera]